MANVNKSIVRIYNFRGQVVGSGFLISPKIVLTCAHVVSVALDLPISIEQPIEVVTLDFPIASPDSKLEANVVFWNPEADIAGLQIKGNLPMEAKHAPMVVSEELWGHSFKVLGFPHGHENGVWASGILLGPTSNNWIQVENSVGYQIQPGFSGSPVWDEQLGGIVGVVVALDTSPNVNAAFLIPSSNLIQKWVELTAKPVNETQSVLPPRRKTKAFLCHAHEDKLAVRNLYKKLKSDGIDPWMDEEDILTGQDWKLEIKKAIRSTDTVIICLSKISVSKSGYVHKEIRESLEIAEEKPEGAIFLIPARLDECNVPEKLKPFNWADLFTDNGYEKLIASLKNLQKE